MTRVLVCGGRDFRDATHLSLTLYRLHKEREFTFLIHGAARGADTLARRWAIMRGIPEKGFPAEWGTYGNAAGPIRNRRMLVEGKPDLVVAFKGGPGTENMVSQARKRGIEVIRA